MCFLNSNLLEAFLKVFFDFPLKKQYNFYRIGPLGRFDLVVAMSVCLSACLSACVSPFHVLDFEAYFAPTSRSRMSKIL